MGSQLFSEPSCSTSNQYVAPYMLDLNSDASREQGPFKPSPFYMRNTPSISPKDVVMFGQSDVGAAAYSGPGVGGPSGTGAGVSVFGESDDYNSMLYVDSYSKNDVSDMTGTVAPYDIFDECPEAMEEDDDDDEEDDGNEFEDEDWMDHEYEPFDKQVDYYSLLNAKTSDSFVDWKPVDHSEQDHIDQQRALQSYQLSISPQQMQVAPQQTLRGFDSFAPNDISASQDDLTAEIGEDEVDIKDNINVASEIAAENTNTHILDAAADMSSSYSVTSASRNSSLASEVSEPSSVDYESDDEDFIPESAHVSHAQRSTLNSSSSKSKRGTRETSSSKRRATNASHRCQLVNPITGDPCNKMFSRPYDLVRHQDTIHAAVRKTFKCEMCPENAKTFSRMDALSRHMRVKHAA